MADQTKQQLNHIDAHGNAIMVDVGAKDITQRIATRRQGQDAASNL